MIPTIQHYILVFILLTSTIVDTFIRAQGVGSPSNVTVCNGATVTTSCGFTEYQATLVATDRVIPHWRIFPINGVPFTLNANESKNGFHYPYPGPNDSEATLIVLGDPSLDGSHVGCRLPFRPPIDSSHNGSIIVIEHPSCPTNISVRNAELDKFVVTWQQSNTQPVTYTTVIYCPKSSPNCGNTVNCTSPYACTISGLDPGTEYQFTINPYNKCGTPLECPENKANLTTKNIGITTSPPSPSPTPTPSYRAGIPVKWLVVGCVLVVAFFTCLCLVSMIICRCYRYKSLKACLENVRNRATKNKVNDTKRKEEEIRIGVVDLSEHTGSTAGTTEQLDCSITSTSE